MLALLAYLSLLGLTTAQFVSNSTAANFTTKQGNAGVSIRYKQVPSGICEQDSSVKSFSGYADVSEHEHYFFWLFEAREPAARNTTTIWINGGPGSSSMIGLFQELGPCSVDANMSVYSNAYSWSNVSNLLFIDQPASVGLSYSSVVNGYLEPTGGTIVSLPNATCPDYAGETCGTYSAWNISSSPNSTLGAAPNFYLTLQGILGAFPQYSSNINLLRLPSARETLADERGSFTESYGGHYGPVFARYIIEQNMAGTNAKINLQNLGIGNGWFDPLLAYQSYYNLTVSPGNPYFGTTLFNASIQQQMYNSLYGSGNCVDQLEACAATSDDAVCMTADQYCAINVETLFDRVTGRDEYDIRELDPDPFPYNFYPQYLNTPAVQDALGAAINFSDYSNLVGGSDGTVVGGAFGRTGDDGREVMTVEDISFLLANNVSVSTYFGDADFNCNFRGGFATLQLVNATGFSSAGFQNMSVPGLNSTQGQVKQSGLFSYALVYESGHEVPFYQPELALALFSRAINRTDIATGLETVNSSYRSTGSPDLPTYFVGNSTVQSDVVPANATYNTKTHLPVLASGGARLRLQRTKTRRMRRV